MKTDVIKTKSTKLIDQINKTWSSAQVDAKNGMEKAIKTGEYLCQLKAITPHGKWEEKFSNVAQDATFGFRHEHATKLMKMAENKTLLLVVAGEDVLSINASQEAIKNATEEQKAEAEKIKAEEEEKARIAEIDKKAKADLEKKKKAEGWVTTEKPVVEKKPAPEKKPAEEVKRDHMVEELDAMLDQQFLDNKLLSEENASLVKVFEASDQLAAAIAEAKKYRDQVAFLNGRIDQLMKEKNEAIQYAKSLKKRLEKLDMA